MITIEHAQSLFKEYPSTRSTLLMFFTREELESEPTKDEPSPLHKIALALEKKAEQEELQRQQSLKDEPLIKDDKIVIDRSKIEKEINDSKAMWQQAIDSYNPDEAGYWNGRIMLLQWILQQSQPLSEVIKPLLEDALNEGIDIARGCSEFKIGDQYIQSILNKLQQ